MTVYTQSEDLVSDFISRGLVLLHPDTLKVDRRIHDRIYEKEKTLFRAKEYITAENLPEILEVLRAPGLVQACDKLLGEEWAIVPFTHNTPFVSGAYDQHWHKDDNGPYNGRKPRYHQPVQLELLYYPQAVTEEMGPTATLPYSQYWTFDHEENHDNFAGADHLDFGYQIEGWETVAVSGKRSNYAEADIKNRHTAHDDRLRRAVDNLAWPLVQPYEAAPIEAGSILLYSHNLFHRGNHRRDGWQSWRDRPRFMWRFWLYRTTNPKTISVPERQAWQDQQVSPDVAVVWESVHAWIYGVAPKHEYGLLEEYKIALYAKGEAAEPNRIGAAYALAKHADVDALSLLAEALSNDRESVRRAATYGLVSAGERSSQVFFDAAKSASKWVRKAAVFGLGTSGQITADVLSCLRDRLLFDGSTYVRSVAADALGAFVRRATAPELVEQAVSALIECLGQEENRESMDRVQRRSIKFVRPTDDCDVCEGIGISLGHERYEPVRSIVRENALGSLVIAVTAEGKLSASTVGRLADCLVVVAANDANLFSAGLAMDALCRLLGPQDPRVRAVVTDQPTLCLPSLLRAGLL